MTSDPPLTVQRTAPAAPARGPSVVLVHGFASSGARDWADDRWARPLARAGRETLVVDLPGHGGGPPVATADEVTTDRVLARLAAAVRSAGTDQIDLVGYSLGARLAWDLVARSPLPVRRLVLGGLSPVEPFGAVDLAAARAFVHGGPPPADPLTGVVAGLVSGPDCDADSLLLLVAGLARQPFDPAATPPAVPTLLVGGDADPMAQGLDGAAAFVPGARVARVPGDHLGALRGDEFRALTFDFLGVDH